MAGIRGYRDESISETPKLERTGAGTDPVRVTCPENSRGKKLIGFSNLFGLEDMYKWDEVRIQGGRSGRGQRLSRSDGEELAGPGGWSER